MCLINTLLYSVFKPNSQIQKKDKSNQLDNGGVTR